MQGAPNVTRMDYLAPLHNGARVRVATEKLLGSGTAAGHVDRMRRSAVRKDV